MRLEFCLRFNIGHWSFGFCRNFYILIQVHTHFYRNLNIYIFKTISQPIRKCKIRQKLKTINTKFQLLHKK